MELIKQFICVRDFKEHVEKILPIDQRAYFLCGSDDESTLSDNEEAFQRYLLLPKMLHNVMSINLHTSILGHQIGMPLCIAPSALHGLLHPDGEKATANGAASVNTVFTMSTYSTTSMEQISNLYPNLLKFFQLYISVDRSVTVSHVRRAEKSGFKALVVTVDLPVSSKLRLRLYHPCNLRPHQKLANFDDNNSTTEDSWTIMENLSDTVLTWDDVQWLKSITYLPVIVKGIMRADDAVKALDNGVDAIYISNHGGRGLDTAAATIDVLPHIAKAVNGRCEIFIDGGFRSGTDILKALALGARAVFIGRPPLFGLACCGELGVKQVMHLLSEELRNAMALCGCQKVSDICRDVVLSKTEYISHL